MPPHPWHGLTHLDFSRPEKPSDRDADKINYDGIDEREWDASLAGILRFLPSLAVFAARNTPAGSQAMLCTNDTSPYMAPLCAC